MNKILTGLLMMGTLLWATPVQDHGALRVSGGKVVDANGNPPQLRGMSFFWSQASVGSKYYNANVVDWLASDWHANIVRAAMGIEGDWSTTEQSYLSDPTSNKNRVKAVVDAAIAKGIYVIIDWHDHNAPNHQSQAVSFFTEMAQTYGSYPNVIYEIFNEPDNENWSTIKSYASPVIAAIRQKDPDNLIIVGTPSYSSDVVTAAKSPITGQTNIAYTFHFYASESWHHDNYMKKADSAINLNLPLFVTEWGLSPASGDGTINTSWANDFWNWMESRKLSSCNWSIADKSESSAALVSGASASGGWSTGNLTTSGNWMRTKLRATNPDPTVATSSSSTALSSSSILPISSSSSNVGSSSIPGTVEVETYTSMSGIQTETTTDAGGGSNLSYIDDGDWTEYSVSISAAGTYLVTARVASNTNGGTITILVDGSGVGSVTVPGTGAWQAWADATASITLPAGTHTVRLAFQGSGTNLFNVNWIRFDSLTPLVDRPPLRSRLSANPLQGSWFDASGRRLQGSGVLQPQFSRE